MRLGSRDLLVLLKIVLRVFKFRLKALAGDISTAQLKLINYGSKNNNNSCYSISFYHFSISHPATTKSWGG